MGEKYTILGVDPKYKLQPHQVRNLEDAAEAGSLFRQSLSPRYGPSAQELFSKLAFDLAARPDTPITLVAGPDSASMCLACLKRYALGARCDDPMYTAEERYDVSMFGFSFLQPGETLESARARGPISGVDAVPAWQLISTLRPLR